MENTVTFQGQTTEILMENFARAMVDVFGGPIGSVLMGTFFPDNNRIDMEQLQETFKKIVEDANAEQTISNQGGIINGILRNITGHYNIEKSKKVKSKILYEYLLEQDSDLNKSLEVLKQPANKKESLPTLVSGQNMQFAILQEVCLQDEPKKPLKSKNIHIIKETAKKESDFIIERHETLLIERLDYITEIKQKTVTEGPPGSSRTTTSFRDNFTGSNFSTSSMARAEDDKKKITEDRKNLICELTNNFEWVLTVAETWKGLIEHPLSVNY